MSQSSEHPLRDLSNYLRTKKFKHSTEYWDSQSGLIKITYENKLTFEISISLDSSRVTIIVLRRDKDKDIGIFYITSEGPKSYGEAYIKKNLSLEEWFKLKNLVRSVTSYMKPNSAKFILE